MASRRASSGAGGDSGLARGDGGLVAGGGKLSSAQKLAMRRYLLEERLSNSEILDRFAADGLVLTGPAVSYWRRLYRAEISAGDLEAIQSGAAVFPLRVAALTQDIAVLRDSAKDKDGKLAKGGAFALMVAGQLQKELRELQNGAQERIFREKVHEDRQAFERQKHADMMGLEAARLELERRKDAREEAKAAREKEKHDLEMLVALAEKELLEQEEESARLDSESKQADFESARSGGGQ